MKKCTREFYGGSNNFAFVEQKSKIQVAGLRPTGFGSWIPACSLDEDFIIKLGSVSF